MTHYTLPNGATVRMEVRDGTNDHNVCYSVLTEDEYQLPTGLTGTAIDVGAHIGSATVALLERNPDLHVVAIEPVPENVELLRRNTAPYADRVTIIEGAAGSGPQRIGYNWRGGETERVHRFIANQHFPASTEHDELTVPGVTLSELVERFGPIAFLKIDAEGAEREFLDDPAREQVERIAGEWHHGPEVHNFYSKDDLPPLSKRDPGERPANRRKRVSKRVAK